MFLPWAGPMLRTTSIACTLAFTSLVAGTAAADPLTPAARPIRFTSLAPDGVETEVRGRVGFTFLDGADSTLTSIQIEGQFMSAAGMGGYLRTSGAQIEDSSGIGNVEVGALYRFAASPDTSVAFRGGLTLPTATDDLDGLANAVATLMTRPSDAPNYVPDFVTLRASVAPTYRTGAITLRADAGLDVPIDTGDNGGDTDPLFHIDVGAGVTSGQISGTVELATVGSTGDGDGTFHALSIGAQYAADKITPSVTFAIPFSSEEDNIFDGYTLLLGVNATL